MEVSHSVTISRLKAPTRIEHLETSLAAVVRSAPRGGVSQHDVRHAVLEVVAEPVEVPGEDGRPLRIERDETLWFVTWSALVATCFRS